MYQTKHLNHVLMLAKLVQNIINVFHATMTKDIIHYIMKQIITLLNVIIMIQYLKDYI